MSVGALWHRRMDKKWATDRAYLQRYEMFANWHWDETNEDYCQKADVSVTMR